MGQVVGAVMGAIGGGSKDTTGGFSESGNTSTTTLKNFSDLIKGQSGLEASTDKGNNDTYNSLLSLLGQGPGAAEVGANNQFQNQYANQLQGLMNNIAAPNQQANFATAQQYFAPQQTALNQQFADQATQSNRLAARLGRGGNDPVMRNMMMKEQTRQQTMLNSQIGAFGQQLPAFQAEQLMGVGNALSNLRGGLATQAMNNRMNLLNMGQQLNQAERNFRLQTATRTGTGSQNGEDYSGGGLKGVMAGAMKGYNAMGGSGGGGGTGGGGGAGGAGGGAMMSSLMI